MYADYLHVSNILMFYYIILYAERFVMNSPHFEHSPRREYPAIKLDTMNFAEHLSDGYVYRKSELSNDDVGTNPSIIDCKTEVCTGLGDTYSITVSELKQEEMVSHSGTEFVTFYCERICQSLFHCCVSVSGVIMNLMIRKKLVYGLYARSNVKIRLNMNQR